MALDQRVRWRLASARERPLFIADCASNQGRCNDLLDHVVLLTAPLHVLLARAATRTNNPYGRRAEDRLEIEQYVREVQPLLRRRATAIWDTSRLTVSGLVERLIALADGQ